jgi:hypothetical protein
MVGIHGQGRRAEVVNRIDAPQVVVGEPGLQAVDLICPELRPPLRERYLSM